MSHAYNIRLQDSQVHAYAQEHCFLNGPDHALNRRLRSAVTAAAIALTPERDSDKITWIELREQHRIEQELAAQLFVPPQFGLKKKTLDQWIANLGWKVRMIPETARSVLVLGSATCREALFIRQRLPHAHIVCTDFVDDRLPQVESLLGVEFHRGDFNQLLEAHRGEFDVVFSNHVLEHLFDPSKTLALACRALSPTGAFIAALPLDGQPDTPFSTALARSPLHPLDMCTVDVAHAWKTNVTDLLEKLSAAGFQSIQLTGRDGHFSVADRVFRTRKAFERRRHLGLLLNRFAFVSTRAALKQLFPNEVPLSVLKTVFGIEHRTWFGSNRLKNEFSIECLLTAR
jgi:SAM-dependent methyltransferase